MDGLVGGAEVRAGLRRGSLTEGNHFEDLVFFTTGGPPRR
jgi:hypothetical protein